MTYRPSLLVLALFLVGCSPDADSQAMPTEGDARASLPTGGPVAAVDGERQRLSTAQLLAYIPETSGRFSRYEMDNTTDNFEWGIDGDMTDAATEIGVRYDLLDHPYSFPMRVGLGDWIDAPNWLARVQQEVAESRLRSMGSSTTIEDLTVAGFPAQAITGWGAGPRLRLLIADRFVVDVWQTGHGGDDPIDMDDLVTFVEESDLPRLAAAPAFADAGAPEIPEWAAAQAAENSAAAAEYVRQHTAATGAGADEEPASGDLRPCDEILPASEVSSVLGGARVDVRPTPGVEVDGQNCNRLYKPAGLAGGIILIVSHYTGTNQSEGALRVASEHDGKVALQPLAGGLNGVRYTHDLESDIHISHFALDTDFVELKATAAGASAPEITPDQLAEVTAIVARRLGE